MPVTSVCESLFSGIVRLQDSASIAHRDLALKPGGLEGLIQVGVGLAGQRMS